MFPNYRNATFWPFASMATMFSAGVVTAGEVDASARNLPPQAQVIDAAEFAVLPCVPSTSEYDGTTVH